VAFCSPTFLRLRETAMRFLPAQTQKRRQPFIVICHVDNHCVEVYMQIINELFCHKFA
jgi:hypothetical protein